MECDRVEKVWMECVSVEKIWMECKIKCRESLDGL